MKKRKGEHDGKEVKTLKKPKVSDVAEYGEDQNNSKVSKLVLTVKGLLQKEQTRLSGMLNICFELFFPVLKTLMLLF